MCQRKIIFPCTLKMHNCVLYTGSKHSLANMVKWILPLLLKVRCKSPNLNTFSYASMLNAHYNIYMYLYNRKLIICLSLPLLSSPSLSITTISYDIIMFDVLVTFFSICIGKQPLMLASCYLPAYQVWEIEQYI